MAELFEEVMGVVDSRSATRSLASQFRIQTEEAAGNGAVLGIPVFVADLARRAADPSQSIALLKTLRSINTAALQNPGVTIESRLYEPVGSELTELLLGDRRSHVASVISGEAGISQRSASSLLPPTAWAVMASIANRYGSRIDRQSLLAILNNECDAMIESGWGPWLQATSAEPLPDVEADPTSGADGQTSAGERDYPPPARRPAGTAIDEDLLNKAWAGSSASPAVAASVATKKKAKTGGAMVRDTPADAAATGREPPEPDGLNGTYAPATAARPSRVWRTLGTLVALCVFFAVVAGAVYWLLDRREDDLGTATDTVDAEVNQVDREQAAADLAAIEDLNVVPFMVQVADPLGESPASGVAELRFDREAGELCYSINSEQIPEPHDGHLRAGGEGGNGELVVDLGRFGNPAIGCVPVEEAVMTAILSDQAGHYVELVNPATGLSLRAQLSENTADLNAGG